MKSLFSLCTVLLAASVCAGNFSSDLPEWNIQVPALELPFDSTIVVTGNEITCSFALKELNEIVKKSTGNEFAIGDGTGKLHRIYIGRSEYVDSVIGKDRLEQFESETSLVFAKDGDLYLVGSDPAGTLWSVYDFVEDNLGYRWYQECNDALRAENEIIDKCDKVIFKGKSTCRNPGFKGFRRDHENWGYFRLFRLRHRSNTEISHFVPGYRFKYELCTSGHGYDLYLPRKEGIPWMKLKTVPDGIKTLVPLFKTHPEYFSVNEKGERSDSMQLCLSSKVTHDALWNSLKLWIEKHGKGVYMVASNDEHTGTYCFCKDCLALDAKFGGQCGALWDCILDLCQRLKDGGYDGVYITSLAYRHQTQLCPPGIVFPDNFICDFAPVTWDRSMSEVKDETLADGRIYKFYENAKNWGKACPGGVSYWYYGSSYCAYTWGRMSKELAEAYDAGIISPGLCGCEGGYEFCDIMHYMWFWCCYNPKGDARTEFYRVCQAKYGPAADEILAYTDILEKKRQDIVKTTPCGPGALDVMTFFTESELKDLAKLHDSAMSKAKGTKFEENVSWARISLDIQTFFKTGDLDAEARARAAATSFYAKVGGPKLMWEKHGIGNTAIAKLDEFANYANLKSDALPPELAQYPKDKVTRILPPKSAHYAPWGGRPRNGWMSSEADTNAVCGYAISNVLPDDYAPGGPQEIRLGLYDHNASKYLIPFQNGVFPNGFWEKDKYKMFCLGRSKYASSIWLVWTDVHGFTNWNGSPPINSKLLSRCYDSIVLDREFETWISVKAQGPKFFPDDTRENRIFIEQMFSVTVP